MLHLVALSEWAGTPDPYTPATLDTEGFVHCSPDEDTALAVANAAPSFRRLDEPLVALVLDEARLGAAVRWEPPSPDTPPRVPEGTLFPRVYAPVGHDAITEVRHAWRDERGIFRGFRRQPATAAALGLLPHPEGGWFRETWASGVTIAPPGYEGERASSTAIYFLLPPGEQSRWHSVRSDELWLWHRGGPLTLLLGGTGEAAEEAAATLTLGPDIESGQVLQALVPGGTWQSAWPAEDAETLVSCVVSPGFDFADFRAH